MLNEKIMESAVLAVLLLLIGALALILAGCSTDGTLDEARIGRVLEQTARVVEQGYDTYERIEAAREARAERAQDPAKAEALQLKAERAEDIKSALRRIEQGMAELEKVQAGMRYYSGDVKAQPKYDPKTELEKTP